MSDTIIGQPCLVCYEENESSKLIKLNCDHFCCSACLSSWIITKVGEPSYQIGQSLVCIASGCTKPFSIQEVSPYFADNFLTAINEALLQIYLNKTNDIRKCPSPSCQYTGIINTSSSCSEYLECAACNFRWREKSHFTKRELIRNFFLAKTHRKNEIFSYIWEKFNTKTCPNCNIRIQKDQGCDHMTCSQCRYEFCWMCRLKTPSHNKRIHAQKALLVVLGYILFQEIYTYLLRKYPFLRVIAIERILPLLQFLGMKEFKIVWHFDI